MDQFFARPGDDIVMTKYAAMCGTAKIAKIKEKELLTRYAKPFLLTAQQMGDQLSVEKEEEIAKKMHASAMIEASQGGIFYAIWQLAKASSVGVDITLADIPIRQHTIEVCEFFDLNPYQLMANGNLLVATPNGGELVRALEKEGIHAAVIGKATPTKDRVVYYGDARRFLEPRKGDEIYKIWKGDFQC